MRLSLLLFLLLANVALAQRVPPEKLTLGVERWHLLDFVWQSEVIHGESTVLLQKDAMSPLLGRLAFPPAEISTIQTSDRKLTFVPGKDVQFDSATGVLMFPADSPAPRILEAELFPPTGSPNSYKHKVGEPEVSLLFGPGRWFHEHQLEVTYSRKVTEWTTPVPQFAGELLPRTVSLLKAGQTLTLGVSGDSISTGADASGVNDIEPRQPGYPDLVTHQLRASYDTGVILKNRSVGGWSIANGLADLDALLAEKPQLIILAYGMNDVGRRDPVWFRDRTKEFLDRVHAADPTIEVIIVTPMLGHADWVHTPREMFFKYRDEVKQFVGPGVALADVTALWQALLERKHDLDLTGNGLNHPNDFGHRLYAQAVLALLVSPNASQN